MFALELSVWPTSSRDSKLHDGIDAKQYLMWIRIHNGFGINKIVLLSHPIHIGIKRDVCLDINQQNPHRPPPGEEDVSASSAALYHSVLTRSNPVKTEGFDLTPSCNF